MYNDPSSKNSTDPLVTLLFPYDPRKWINFALQVMNDRIILYNDCEKVQEIGIIKKPRELSFESSS